MRYKHILWAGLIALASCSKGSDDPAPFTLEVTPKHHGRPIDSCMIYIKYNSVDPPANGVYDDSARCVPLNGLPVATFSNVKHGNHYLYGYGWDPLLSPPQAVKGGYAYPDPTDGKAVQTVELAVSED